MIKYFAVIYPTRQAGMDAKIELTDDVPIHRKQFPVSAEQREAIRAWTTEMLAKQERFLDFPTPGPPCWARHWDSRRSRTRCRTHEGDDEGVEDELAS